MGSEILKILNKLASIGLNAVNCLFVPFNILPERFVVSPNLVYEGVYLFLPLLNKPSIGTFNLLLLSISSIVNGLVYFVERLEQLKFSGLQQLYCGINL